MLKQLMHQLKSRKNIIILTTLVSYVACKKMLINYLIISHCSLLCKAGTLDPKKVKGNILVCLRGDNARIDKGQQALLAGAVGMVLANAQENGNELLADPHLLPASHINFTDGADLFRHVNSTK